MRAEPSLGLLTYGPIKINMPGTPQSSKLLSADQIKNKWIVQMFASGVESFQNLLLYELHAHKWIDFIHPKMGNCSLR